METTSSPLSWDSDEDDFPDSAELEQGSDPMNAASVPFDFPGAISGQFVSERAESGALGPWEYAGYFRMPHWNASGPLPQWVADGTVLAGSMSS